MRGTPVIEIGTSGITQDEAEHKLLSLKQDKAPGPNVLHPKALKELPSVFGVPFAIIFNMPLHEGVLPECKECHGRILKGCKS